jgi:hypothetical protein
LRPRWTTSTSKLWALEGYVESEIDFFFHLRIFVRFCSMDRKKRLVTWCKRIINSVIWNCSIYIWKKRRNTCQIFQFRTDTKKYVFLSLFALCVCACLGLTA